MWKTTTHPVKHGFKWAYLSYLKEECKDQPPQSFYFYPNRHYRYEEIELDIHRYMTGKDDLSSQISMDPIEFRMAPQPATREERAMQLYSCVNHMTEEAVYQPETVRFTLQQMNRSRLYTYTVLLVLIVLAVIYIISIKNTTKMVIAYVIAFLLFYYLITAMFFNRIL